ncbi:MAG TPA: hypothetical protein VG842_03410, partial [Sediminibacterium sp.]|nr:hypothetical protein [Sediminibacterium sp.]
MNTKHRGLLFGLLFLSCGIRAQQPAEKTYTHQDTLRGSITPERAWWDVLHYSILVKPDYADRSITGKVDIRFKVLKNGKRMQIDLQEPMELTKAFYKNKALSYTREGNVYYVEFPQSLLPGTLATLSLAYRGHPRVAKRPPWDGGWIFTKDARNRPWMSVACQGLGASVWYPCK